MWYVKNIEDIATPFSTSFYIKWYVKVGAVIAGVVLLASFILTMWYVNVKRLESLIAGENNFILTKWYVKGGTIIFPSSSMLGFYIN